VLAGLKESGTSLIRAITNIKKYNNKYVSKTHTRHTAYTGAVKTMSNTPPSLFKDIFVAYFLPLSTRLKGSTMSAPVQAPDITSASCDLDLDLLTPRSTVHVLARDHLCQYALKSVHSFSKYSVHNFVTDEQGRSQQLWGGGRKPMPSADREPITRVWGGTPSESQGQNPW